jgi:hypothetical protein
MEVSATTKCAVIAAAARFGGKASLANLSENICDGLELYEMINTRDVAKGALGLTCVYLGEVFATGVGTAAAGASSASGPGAVAVGIKTWRALSAFTKVSCALVFSGAAKEFGQLLEAKHQLHIARDIVNAGRCLRMRRVFGLLSWSAAECAG